MADPSSSRGDPASRKRHRKKRVPTVQNQFFLHHVREMRDQAMAKNWQSKHTYAKMVRALERYPLRLEGPRACLILDGFGQKTCEVLAKKLADYAKELGHTEDEALRIGNEKFATPKSLKLKVRKPPKLRRTAMGDGDLGAASASGVADHSVSDSESADSDAAATAGPASASPRIRSRPPSVGRRPSESSLTQQLANQSQQQKQQQQQNRPYHPKPRTGAHAILVTLLQCGGVECSLGKADLIAQAQPLCDSSFTCPAAGSHYTAWSAMGGLVKRGLVDRSASRGRIPGAYALTEAGRAAAASAASAASAVDGAAEDSPAVVRSSASSGRQVRPRMSSSSAAVHSISDSSEAEDGADGGAGDADSESEAPYEALPPPPPSPPPSPPPPPPPQEPQVSLQFAYCAEGYTLAETKTGALRRFDAEFDCECALVVCDYEQLVRSNLLYSLDLGAIGRFEDGKVAAFLRIRDLPELSTKAAAVAKAAAEAAAKAASEAAAKAASEAAAKTAAEAAAKAASEAAAKTAAKAAAEAAKIAAANKPALETEPARRQQKVQMPSAAACASPLKTSASALSAQQPLVRQLTKPPLLTSKPLAWQRQASAQQSAGGAAAPDGETGGQQPAQPRLMYTIQGDQYDVIFCIDNREHFGMGSVKQMLLPGLLRNQVKCDVRPLQVSDFLWVAKCRDTGREAVLNLLVERKRLDDLATSIKDGRFREQKFRLRRTGVSQLLLLVEGFGGRGSGHVRMPEETLAQAVCNSQLIDGCAVKYTESAQHTVSYLTLLTAKLTDMYRGRRLLVHDALTSMPGETRRATMAGVLTLGERAAPGADVRAVDFVEFNRAAVKSKKLVVKEMLAKHLLQIGGITMDKAFAIVQEYPTVQALLDAYKACPDEAHRKRLLSSICYDRLFDKLIGEQISRSVRLNFVWPDGSV